jgi:hypothetical protein
MALHKIREDINQEKIKAINSKVGGFPRKKLATKIRILPFLQCNYLNPFYSTIMGKDKSSIEVKFNCFLGH